MAKVQVTVRSVETANRMMQQGSRGTSAPKPSGYWVVKPATPSQNDIAKAGQRALQSLKKAA